MWYEGYLIKRACTEKRALTITELAGLLGMGALGASGGIDAARAGKPDDPNAVDENKTIRALAGIPAGVVGGGAGGFLGSHAGEYLDKLLQRRNRTALIPLSVLGTLTGAIAGSRLGGVAVGKLLKRETRKADEEQSVKRACTEKRAFTLPEILLPGASALLGSSAAVLGGRPDDPNAVDENETIRSIVGVPAGLLGGGAGGFLGAHAGHYLDKLIRRPGRNPGAVLPILGLFMGGAAGSHVGGRLAGKLLKRETRKADEEQSGVRAE